jgi:hypothetical protein
MTGPSAPLALTAHLALLSSISFGGFPTVLPDVRNFVVIAHGWMTDPGTRPQALCGPRPPGSRRSIAAAVWRSVA